MNRNILRIAAAAALLAGGQAALADTQPLVINATITPTCLLQTMPTMSLTLDPTLATDGSGTATVQYKCTKGTSGTFTVGGQADGTAGASTTLNGPGGDTMPISITWPAVAAFTGNGLAGTANSVVLTGKVLNSDYVTKTAGTYTGSINVTITP